MFLVFNVLAKSQFSVLSPNFVHLRYVGSENYASKHFVTIPHPEEKLSNVDKRSSVLFLNAISIDSFRSPVQLCVTSLSQQV